METMQSPDRTATRSAVHERILGVLGAFSADRPALTLTDLADATGLPLSTLHRIVANLVAWGALERDGRHYVIGLRLFEVATLAPRAYRQRDRIFPFLEDLFAATRENVLFSVLEGGEALMVEQLVGHRAVRLVAGLGERVPLHASAMGQVMLAFGPGQVLDEIADMPLPAYTGATITSGPELRAVIRDVRRQGVSVSRSALDEQSISIAAPVFGPRKAFVGAVSIVTAAHHTDVRAYSAAVMGAARGISRAIADDSADRGPVYRPLRNRARRR